jgi:hypothetical protein
MTRAAMSRREPIAACGSTAASARFKRAEASDPPFVEGNSHTVAARIHATQRSRRRRSKSAPLREKQRRMGSVRLIGRRY